MRYGINTISNDELITRYFEREENILVRYRSGRTEVVSSSSRDSLEDIMREQANEFIEQRSEVRKEALGELGLTGLMCVYVITYVELIIKGLFGGADPITAVAGFVLWILGENMYSYLVYEKDFKPGSAKEELRMIKKYKLFLKYEKRILEYLKENPREFTGKINDLDFTKIEEVKELIRLSKRKK